MAVSSDPHGKTEVKDLDGTSAFTDMDETVINYKGTNYYKACGIIVVFDYFDYKDITSCVKRVGHLGNEHEDYNGNKRSGWLCPRCSCHNDQRILFCLRCAWPEVKTSVPETE